MELLHLISDQYSLRYLENSKQYVGIHDGLCMAVSEFRGTVQFYVFSPTAELGDQILETFAGFVHLRESGIPPDWVRGNMLSNRDVDQHGCILELSPAQLQSLSDEQFLGIPHHLAQDFLNFGAENPIPTCPACGAEAPRHLAYVGRTYHILCDRCLSDLKVAAPDGRLQDTEPVRWGPAFSTLFLGTALFVIAWGLMQQPSFEMSLQLLLLVPFLSSVCLVRAVTKAASGHSVLLRLATVMAIVSATVAGNIWGFRSLAFAQNVPLTWGEAVDLYFRHQLPNNGEVEFLYLLGGAAGAWFGLSILKTAGFIRVE
jgi:hypothetical protein